jgi:hypothetical protein
LFRDLLLGLSPDNHNLPGLRIDSRRGPAGGIEYFPDLRLGDISVEKRPDRLSLWNQVETGSTGFWGIHKHILKKSLAVPKFSHISWTDATGGNMAESERVVIHGTREDGSKLRPSDWIERLSSALATFGKGKRLQYSASVKPCMIEGKKCLVVSRCLEESDPQAYAFVMAFAKSNQLKIQLDRREGERALPCPVPVTDASLKAGTP